MTRPAQQIIDSGDPLLDHLSRLVAHASRLYTIALGEAAQGQSEAARETLSKVQLLVDDLQSWRPELETASGARSVLIDGLNKVSDAWRGPGPAGKA